MAQPPGQQPPSAQSGFEPPLAATEREGERPARRRWGEARGLTRWQSAGVLAIGLGFGAWNGYLLAHEGRYYPMGTMMTPVGVLLGLVGIVFGRGIDPETGRPQLRARIAYSVAALVGISIGVAVVARLGGFRNLWSGLVRIFG